jgi:hypothetical protein
MTLNPHRKRTQKGVQGRIVRDPDTVLQDGPGAGGPAETALAAPALRASSSMSRISTPCGSSGWLWPHRSGETGPLVRRHSTRRPKGHSGQPGRSGPLPCARSTHRPGGSPISRPGAVAGGRPVSPHGAPPHCREQRPHLRPQGEILNETLVFSLERAREAVARWGANKTDAARIVPSDTSARRQTL